MAANKTLVLNASWEPLGAVKTARALWLVMKGDAEIISSEPTPYHSADEEFTHPTVIRLIVYRKVPYERKAYLSRKAVLRRDDYECCYCTVNRADTMDHVYPRFLGGKHRWENVVACCDPCNQAKGHKTLEELGWTMRFVPYRPEGGKRIVIHSGVKPHPDWVQWLNLDAA